MSVSDDNMVWLDMEMSGLDPNHDKILEIATLVTDKDLNILAEGPALAIHQDDSVLKGMDEWNTRHHTNSGLVERVRQSTISTAEAEKQTIDFIKQYVNKGKSPLCGNSIFQDRRFIYNYMPELDRFLHYRLVDVSTVKELARRWHRDIYDNIKKANTHKALDDIRESIAELQYYRKNFFKLP